MLKISPYVFPGSPLSYRTKQNGKQLLPLITIGDIVYTVCNRTGISLEEIRTTSRKRTIADTRAMIYYLSNKHTAFTHSQILYHLRDTKHHRCAIINSTAKIENLISTDATFNDMIKKMQVELFAVDLDRLIKSLTQAA
jgi:chromosomal replication initiation ATPase DnaA